MVVSELRGEKIDIIPYNEEPARFVAKALSPARVREVLVDDETKEATVIVPDDQLSLAIGRDGQNARLAARLTGWKVDITSETDFAQQEDDIEYEGEEAADGRCMAVMTTGRRCPNAALQGSQFCGLPQHQALARFSTNQVAVLTPLSDEEVATLADGEADEGRDQDDRREGREPVRRERRSRRPRRPRRSPRPKRLAEAEEAGGRLDGGGATRAPRRPPRRPRRTDVPEAGDEAEGAEQNLGAARPRTRTPRASDGASEDGGEPEAEERRGDRGRR